MQSSEVLRARLRTTYWPFFLPLQEEPKRAEHNGAEQQGHDVAFAVERNAQHAHTGEIERHGAHTIALERRPQGGADYADQHEDVDDHTAVERQSQHIDEEKSNHPPTSPMPGTTP